MHNICCLGEDIWSTLMRPVLTALATPAVFDKEDPDQVKRMKKLIEVCISDAASLGYGEYRTHIGKAVKSGRYGLC